MWPQQIAKAGSSEIRRIVKISIYGLHSVEAQHSCLKAINRQRVNPLELAEGDYAGDFQIVVEKKRPGYQVRIERDGTPLRTGRALHEYEVCIAVAVITRETISDR